MENNEVVENNVSNNSPKKNIIIIVIVVILIIVAGLTIFLVTNKKHEEASSNDTKETDTTKQEDTKKQDNEEDEKPEVLFSRKDDDMSYEVVLKKNTLYVNDKEVATNITKYYDLSIGGDMCEGNRYIITLHDDKTIGALSIDMLTCGEEIDFTKNIGNLKNVTNVYSEKGTLVPGEPQFNKIYVDTDTEQHIDITEKLSE